MKGKYLKIVMTDRNEFRTTADLSFRGTDYKKVCFCIQIAARGLKIVENNK